MNTALDTVGPLTGKVVIDTMNPLKVSSDFRHSHDTAFMATSSTSEELQRRHPGARVVKAFSTLPSDLVDRSCCSPGDPGPQVFVASDDPCCTTSATTTSVATSVAG